MNIIKCAVEIEPNIAEHYAFITLRIPPFVVRGLNNSNRQKCGRNDGRAASGEIFDEESYFSLSVVQFTNSESTDKIERKWSDKYVQDMDLIAK